MEALIADFHNFGCTDCTSTLMTLDVDYLVHCFTHQVTCIDHGCILYRKTTGVRITQVYSDLVNVLKMKGMSMHLLEMMPLIDDYIEIVDILGER